MSRCKHPNWVVAISVTGDGHRDYSAYCPDCREQLQFDPIYKIREIQLEKQRVKK